MIGDLLTSLQSGLSVENKKTLEGEAVQPERLFSEVMAGSQKSVSLSQVSEEVGVTLGSLLGVPSAKSVEGDSKVIPIVDSKVIPIVDSKVIPIVDSKVIPIVDAELGGQNENLSGNGDNFPTVLLGNHAIIRESHSANSSSLNSNPVVMVSDLIKSVTDADGFSKSSEASLSGGVVVSEDELLLVADVMPSSFADYLSMDERRLSAYQVPVVGNVEKQTAVSEFFTTTEHTDLGINENVFNSVSGSDWGNVSVVSASPLGSRLGSYSEPKENLSYSLPSNSVLGGSLNGDVKVASFPLSAQLPLAERVSAEGGDVSYAFVKSVLGSVESLNRDSVAVKQEALVLPKQQEFMSIQNSPNTAHVLKPELKPSFIASDYKQVVSVKSPEQVVFLPSVQALSASLDNGVSVGFKVPLGLDGSKQSAVVESTLADLPAKLKESIASNQTAMTIRLKPYELGRIDVQIKDVGGELQMVFKAEKHSTLDVLQSNESALRSTFKDGQSLELSYGGSGKDGSGRGGSDKRETHDSLPAGFVESEAQLVSNSQSEIENRGLNIVV